MAEVGCRADLANWAAAAGWRLRASGYSHNWSPLAIDPVRSDPARVLLVDLRAGMSSVQVDAASRQVSAGAAATAPVPGRPELDTVVWLSILTKPGTPGAWTFFDETEQWFFGNSSAYAVPRVEWSKGWAYTGSGPYTDAAMLGSTLPSAYGSGFATARATLNALDPRRIYSSPLLDHLLP